jgi:hypothetical protein
MMGVRPLLGRDAMGSPQTRRARKPVDANRFRSCANVDALAVVQCNP